MREYIAEHPRADELTAPLWPSRKNGGGNRPKGKRYAVPFDWTQPIAMGTFGDTIFKPALESVGLPARPGVRIHDLRHTSLRDDALDGGYALHAGVKLGHSTFTLTFDTYGDWIPEEDGGAANLLQTRPLRLLVKLRRGFLRGRTWLRSVGVGAG